MNVAALSVGVALSLAARGLILLSHDAGAANVSKQLFGGLLASTAAMSAVRAAVVRMVVPAVAATRWRMPPNRRLQMTALRI